MELFNKLFNFGRETTSEGNHKNIRPTSEFDTEPPESEPITEDFSDQDNPTNSTSSLEAPPKYDDTPPPEYESPGPNPEVNHDQTNKSQQKKGQSR